MSVSPPPSNNLSWRVTVLEREVDLLKQGKPDVVAERVATLSTRIADLRLEFREDIEAVRKELEQHRADRSSDRKILIGFFVSFALLALGIALTYVLAGQGVTP